MKENQEAIKVENTNEEPVLSPIIEETTPVIQQPQNKLSKKELREQEKQKKKEEKERERQEKLAKKEQLKAQLPPPPPPTPFFKILAILIIIVLAGYSIYSSKLYRSTIQQLTNICTPLQQVEKETPLDINSFLVQSLYKKVYTNIREDLAQPEWNNEMKLYLAYRQIGDSEKYESNCNMFQDTSMEPYICEETNQFTPLAFHQDSLIMEYKKLFGENSEFHLENIKLQNACIGGYQYIPEREEFVQGKCTQQTTTSYKVTKTLKEATVKRNTIVLVEEVRYREGESVELPDYLKSGTYYYTFRLDMNYNFILVSKTYEAR